jgi:hypothetical protein
MPLGPKGQELLESAMLKQRRKIFLRTASGKAYRIILQVPLASIEKLPIEILEQIFDLACDMNLPKASWQLMKKLQGHRIYKTMLAFTSGPALTGASKKPDSVCLRNLILEDLPLVSDNERFRLQQEVFSSKWLTPRFIARLQSHFVSQVTRARWRTQCLRKSYGAFKIRPSLRAVWRETMFHEDQSCPIEGSAGHFYIPEAGTVRFRPEINEEFEEEWSFPAREQPDKPDVAPFPDDWYSGPWVNQEKELITLFASKRFGDMIMELPNDSEGLASWMLEVAILEQNVDVILNCIRAPFPEPDDGPMLSPLAIRTTHLTRFLAIRGEAPWKAVHMAALLLMTLNLMAKGSQHAPLIGEFREWVRARLPRKFDWIDPDTVEED